MSQMDHRPVLGGNGYGPQVIVSIFISSLIRSGVLNSG